MYMSQRRVAIAGKVAAMITALLVGVAGLVVALSAARLLPQFRNPFAETTTARTGPVLLRSITPLSRYEAASGSFQVVVDLARRSSFVPSFIEGTNTLFVGVGTDIAFVDFSHLSGKAVVVSPDRTAVTIRLPAAQLEPAALDLRQSYVFAEQQGLLNRIGSFFASNPNDQHQVYVLAQQKIHAAAQRSGLIGQAEVNTRNMLTSMMHSLGYHRVTVIFAGI
jgi:uncharacterized protein DUF4230